MIIGPAELIWSGIAGVLALGWMSKQADGTVQDAGTAAAKASGLAKWLVIGGGLYVAYEVARKAGYAK